jgi:hypothetical protein
MKKNRHTKSLTFSDARWLAYAAAGAATALSGTPSAEAEIHYSGVINFRFSEFDEIVKGFPLGESAKLVFLNGYGVFYHGDVYYGAWFGVRGAAVSNQFRGYTTSGVFGPYYVSRLAPAKAVSQGGFVGQGPLAFLASSYGRGPWGSQGHGQGRLGGFVGFRFDNGNGKQYGWARLRLSHPEVGAAEGFILVDYAWADSGDTIVTGQTSSAGDIVETTPDSGSLGLLALGHVGLQAWREGRAVSGR